VVSARRWREAVGLVAHPVHGRGVQLVQVVQVVAAVATPEHVDVVIVRVSCVHVARARRYACAVVGDPLQGVKV